MMDVIIFTLNLPWSLIGMVTAFLSLPKKIEFSRKPPAIIFHVRSFWWYSWIPRFKKVRGITNGHVISVNDEVDDLDVKHELIHVEQYMKYPFIFSVIFLYEQLIHGFGPERNRFEKEAYGRSGSRYLYKSK